MTARTDRELLELAAKAVGICLDWEWNGPPDQWQPWYYEDETLRHWNPLTDDGDALRLAVKLGLLIDIRYTDPIIAQYNCVTYWLTPLKSARIELGDLGLDQHAATRRAIVRAAAEIGGKA